MKSPALLLSYYGDDFTGSTDALEQLTLAGIRTVLFTEPPTQSQIARFKNLQAIGVAGMTRSMTPAVLERELRPALKKLKGLGARHVHYKVCSTFDSSPNIGSIGRAIDVGAEIFRAPFVPLLVAAPALGRYTVFGTHFARFGIGSQGAIHRLDRHPSVSRHPVTPMTEADLRLHLGKQTKKRIGLFDILKLALPLEQARAALRRILVDGAKVVLFDAIYQEQLKRIGELLDGYASAKTQLFSVGSSGIEMALGACWSRRTGVAPVSLFKTKWRQARRLSYEEQLLVGSGSCSPVTAGQINWALKHRFAEVPVNVAALAATGTAPREIHRAAVAAAEQLGAGRNVILHTTGSGLNKRISTEQGKNMARALGTALGQILRSVLVQTHVRRLCIAGGDTSSYAARALGIEALEMIAPLTPGAPLCRATAPGSPADGLEVVFKGGQVGAEDYFSRALHG